MTVYYRPIVQTGPIPRQHAHRLAGGWCWFDRVERRQRGEKSELIQSALLAPEVLETLTKGRPDVLGLPMSRPCLMGILNVTPDSFSDGGQFRNAVDAKNHASAMAGAGADIIDIGGESTRPGAKTIASAQEIDRIIPVISAIRRNNSIPISVDTRKSSVAQAALDGGANMINDVSALEFDPALARIAAANDVPICLMHAKGDPKTMQDDPVYDDVVLDVYDDLLARILVAEKAGIVRKNIVVDPGIGFGKTLNHNIALLRNISLFHGLGCPILLGASRKRFIGTLGDAPLAADRGPGSIAVTLAAAAQGVQIHRVHDVNETRQALTLWAAATGTEQ